MPDDDLAPDRHPADPPAAPARQKPAPEPGPPPRPRAGRAEPRIGHRPRGARLPQASTASRSPTSPPPTGLSIGMLSKIENGNTSPSLTTLQALSHALRRARHRLLPPLRGAARGAVFVKAGEGLEIERRGTRAGHQYHLLGHIGVERGGVVVEPYLITLTEESDVFPTFQHDGHRAPLHAGGRGRSTATATASSTCGPATACSSTPTPRTGRRYWTSCRPATCR